ncbi:MAG TPA: hypothetical protein PLZ08_01880 [Bacillota bacterium]|nr:hypothetical protein [Bacillota bacterium]HOL09015.1 hypothetical protein [Bacillota bacterium]HPO96690.1 hypothetical protein [Bacillota bacterium]
MDEIDQLIELADSLFAEGEAKSEVNFAAALAVFRQGISSLLNAFLIDNEATVSKQATLRELFMNCLELEPEFEAIEAEVDWVENPESDDCEELVDKVNEIWDFVIDLL